MSVHHHPSDMLLFDYATGSLDEAWSVAIATHLALCPVCREKVAEYEAMGGVLLETTQDRPQTADIGFSFEDLLGQIDSVAQESRVAVNQFGPAPIFPQPLREYVGGDLADLKWQNLGRGAQQYVVPTSKDGITARLLRVPAGKPVPEHGHGGMELTLVLKGAFTDHTGTYGPGDLQEADPSIQHQPVATPDQDCICLAITDAPLKFTNIAARIAQPFLGI